jgi:CTP synthase (UTP-ammonia lyase)
VGLVTALIGVIGDFVPGFEPHEAIAGAVGHSAAALGVEAEVRWLDTLDVETADLAEYDALWCAPGSPYKSLDGALRGIRFAREENVPFIGTCGGFQHVVLEYARNVLGFADARHAEYDPDASVLFVSKLECSLVGQTMSVRLDPGSRAADFYGATETNERYYCNFGLNPEHQDELDEGGLRVVGSDQDGEARVLELPEHRFFIATLFVPQTSSSADEPHPLISAYVAESAGVPAANASAASRSNSP